MTTPDVRQSRSYVVRVIAASLAFDQDPPILRTLKKAREAGDAIYDALVENGVINGNGAGTREDADADDEPLFPPNGIVTDPES